MNAKASSAHLPTQSVVVGSTTGNDCNAAIPSDINSVNLSDADDDGGRDCRACRVCGQLSHGYHFGILACRACAAFFRRTVVEKKTYRCRQSGQCQIRKEMRNMCRSCRFDLCIQLGMNKDDVQMYRDPIGKRRASKIESSVEENGKAAVSLAADAESDTNYGSPRLSSVVEQNVGGGIGISSTGAASLSSVTVSSSPSSSTRLLHVALPQPIRPLQQQPSGDKQHQLQQCFTAEAAGGSTLETPTIALLPCAIPSGADPTSVLQRLVDGYRNFQSSQKSLYTVMYPDNIFAAETYRMVKHAEYVKMERGCISLQFSMLVDCFQPFDSLNQQLKVAALRVFSNRFTHLDQCFRTATIFPANDDPRFVLHYGQYMNVNKLEEFFTDVDSNEEEIHKSCKKTFQRCRDVVNKMNEMAVRDVEVAALAAIILWNELAYMNVEGTDRVRSAIFAELHSNMILTYGIANTGIRLGSLMDLIHDMNVIEKEIRESVIIGNFFNPNFAEVWDDA